MSRPPRFFISPEQVVSANIVVTGEDVHRITTVLRMKPGELLILGDGQGTDYTVKIARMSRAEIGTEIVGQLRREMLSPRIILGQGLPKSDKMDWIVQKATELGVAAIVPLITERTIVKIRDEQKRIDRWRKIAHEAAMQSDRPDIPRIEQIRQMSDYIQTRAPEPRTLLLFPWEGGAEPIKKVLRRREDVREVVVLIGPEGGFSDAEAEVAQRGGFHVVSLGPTILRTETAAMTAIGMIGYELFPN